MSFWFCYMNYKELLLLTQEVIMKSHFEHLMDFSFRSDSTDRKGCSMIKWVTV